MLHGVIDGLNAMGKSCEHNAKGLRSMKERGFSDAGMLEKVIEVTALQCEQIRNLAGICKSYAMSDKFAVDLAMLVAMDSEKK